MYPICPNGFDYMNLQIGDKIISIVSFRKQTIFEGSHELIKDKVYNIYNIRNNIITLENGNYLIGPFTLNELTGKIKRIDNV